MQQHEPSGSVQRLAIFAGAYVSREGERFGRKARRCRNLAHRQVIPQRQRHHEFAGMAELCAQSRIFRHGARLE
ncbi:hypothetical protein GCM10009860_00530 [Microbacterium mitrae]